MIEHHDTRYYLDWAAEIAKTHQFIDFHVHPFDVFSGDVDYQADPVINGLFTRSTSVYKPPIIDRIDIAINGYSQTVVENPRALLLASRFTYRYTGPKVFNDQLDLAGITRALLLPVVRNVARMEQLIEAVEKIFQAENRLHIACPFPVGIPPDKIVDYYQSMKNHNKRICAIKIHPNLAGIDPGTKVGKELIDNTLVAGGNLRLPVIVHGGISIGLSSPESERFSTLERLANINWNAAGSPVIIAHAGCYGLSEEEINSVIPILNRLMETHPNMLADVSALNLQALHLVLTKIDRNRLIFGSDALYFSIWKAWVRFLCALRRISPNPDEDLIRIASLNPIQCLAYSGNPAL